MKFLLRLLRKRYQFQYLLRIIGLTITNTQRHKRTMPAANTEDKKPIFDTLSVLRKSKKLTYQELSDRSGVPMPTLFGLKKHAPSNTTLKAIADALGVSTDELLGLEQRGDPDQPRAMTVPVWKMADYPNAIPIQRFLIDCYGPKTFGLILDPRDSACPKGSIFYFDPDLAPQDGDTLFLQVLETPLVRKLHQEGDKMRFVHLKYDEASVFNDYKILGTCVLITIDPFSAQKE